LDIAPSASGIRHLMAVDDRRADPATGDDVLAPPAAAGKPSKHCGAGSAGIAIDPFGNVYPCVQWRRSVASLHERSLREIWADSFGEIRATTAAAAGIVAAHPHGKLLNFCPGLAEVLTGSALQVPKEMERVAAIVDGAS
ncbi:MAG: radical domain protein, partial [Acidobacteria bacterium]|nr:radical domain protein [Acidobacteriota bacterium]